MFNFFNEVQANLTTRRREYGLRSLPISAAMPDSVRDFGFSNLTPARHTQVVMVVFN